MKKISSALRTLRILIFGWGIVVPLTYLFPLKKNMVLFIGKNDGLFYDNIKYLYLYLHRLKRSDIRYYFLTKKKSVYTVLKEHNLPVLFYPSLRSTYALICSKVIVMCCTWNKRISFRAKKIQLWHGVPLKRIGLLAPAVAKVHNSRLGRFNNAIRGRNYVYDLFVSTSDYFTEHIFSKAMRARNYIESGYPRNDIFFKEQLDDLDLLEADVESLGKIDEFRNDGFKSVLYAPTWNDPMGNAVESGFLDLEKLSSFAKNNKLLFVFKFHPSEHRIKKYGQYDKIIYYDGYKDIQPLLKVTDILITDYSSVYMDYLLLDRPIIFFPYNYERYIESRKGFLFDYKTMTPGPICYSQDQLQQAIESCAAGDAGSFADKRAEIKKLAFKYEDGRASERVWDFIVKRYIET